MCRGKGRAPGATPHRVGSGHVPGLMRVGSGHVPGLMRGGNRHVPGLMRGGSGHVPGLMRGGCGHVPGLMGPLGRRVPAREQFGPELIYPLLSSQTPAPYPGLHSLVFLESSSLMQLGLSLNCQLLESAGWICWDPLCLQWASLLTQMVPNLPAMHGLNPWVGKIPWRRAWQPTPVFLPGELHGQRSLRSDQSLSCVRLFATP